ncbi:phospholipase D-like domain-containing protein [Pseudanabaena sp. PCC 6802]|uniref:phospholipase D-like domain-containing protein n=1 Tax=Pseudanabaena sp. PCC 6802 TaxID=118173 RepID=UPI00138ABE6B|nr:phospholipase D-like domain-containing protein [Pseudanabaena sp. PCC 6802]
MNNWLLRQRQKHPWGIYALLFVLGLAIAIGIYFIFFRAEEKLDAKVPSLPQHPQIQVYMNHNESDSYTDRYRRILRYGDNLERILLDNINQADTSIDVAVQELRLPSIVKALIERQKAGVKVRLILDNTYNRSYSEYTSAEIAKLNSRAKQKYRDFFAFVDVNRDGKLSPTEISDRDAIVILKNSNLPYIDDTADNSRGTGLMHHKFMVIDEKVILAGSANYTMSDIHGDFSNPNSTGNANNLVRIENEEVAKLFTQEFDLMWGDGPGGQANSLFGSKKPYRKVKYVLVGDAQVRVKFSPDSRNLSFEQTSSGLIGTVLASGEQSADLALFVFSEPVLGNILETRQKKNVNVRVLVDSNFAYRNYATTLDMWGFVSTQDCKFGNGRPWAAPIKTAGIPSLSAGDLLHHKFATIDRHLVVTGSHNWSINANYNNDEAIVAINNPVVAAHFQREFDRLYANAILGPTVKLKKSAPTICPSKLKGIFKPENQTLVPAKTQAIESEETLPNE